MKEAYISSKEDIGRAVREICNQDIFDKLKEGGAKRYSEHTAVIVARKYLEVFKRTFER